MWQSGKGGLGRSRDGGTTRTGMCDRADAPALPMLARPGQTAGAFTLLSKASSVIIHWVWIPADVRSHGFPLLSLSSPWLWPSAEVQRVVV